MVGALDQARMKTFGLRVPRLPLTPVLRVPYKCDRSMVHRMFYFQRSRAPRWLVRLSPAAVFLSHSITTIQRTSCQSLAVIQSYTWTLTSARRHIKVINARIRAAESERCDSKGFQDALAFGRCRWQREFQAVPRLLYTLANIVGRNEQTKASVENSISFTR